MSASLQLPGGLKTLNPQPEIARYYNLAEIPYISTSQILNEIAPAVRYVGQTFLVGNSEYWFNPTTADADLKPKLVNDSDVLHKTGNETKTGNLILNGTLVTSGTITTPAIVKSGAVATNILLAGGTDIPQSTFALASGNGNYIQNQNASAQTANMWISGTGQFGSTLTATSFIKSGGTTFQFLKADGSIDSTLYENSANKQNNLNYDGTGIKYPTVDTTNDLTREISKFASKTGVLSKLDSLNLLAFNDFTARITAVTSCMFWNELFITNTSPASAIRSFAQKDYPLSQLLTPTGGNVNINPLTTDGKYVRYIGYDKNGNVFSSQNSFLSNNDILQIGFLTVLKVGSTISFLDGAAGVRNVFAQPSIASNTDFDKISATITNITAFPNSVASIGTSNGNITGISINWKSPVNPSNGNPIDVYPYLGVATAAFRSINPLFLNGTAALNTHTLWTELEDAIQINQKFFNTTTQASGIMANGTASVKRILIGVRGGVYVQDGEHPNTACYPDLITAKNNIFVHKFSDAILPPGVAFEIARVAYTKSATVFTNDLQFYLVNTAGGSSAGTSIVPTIADATTVSKGILKLAGDLGGTADLPTTPTAIHKTGDETKTGKLIFDNGPNVGLINGIQTNAGLNAGSIGAIFNATGGTAISSTISGGAKGIDMVSDGTFAINILSNSPTVTGTVINVNGSPSSAGFLYRGQNNGTNTFTVDKLGNIVGASLVKSGAVATNILLAGGTDIPQSTFALASGNGNYIQNQNASAQTANFWINGIAKITGFGVNANPDTRGTSANSVIFKNDGGDFYIGQEGNSAGGFFNGSFAYDNVFYGGRPYNFIINGTSKLYINTNGDIGLGTVVPITGGGGAKWITAEGTTTYGGGLISSINGVAQGFFYSYNNYAILGGSNGKGVKLTVNGGAESVTVLPNGNVGVGTQNPSVKLEVAGEIMSTAQGNPLVRFKSTQLDTANRNWDLLSNAGNFGDFDLRVSNSQGADPDRSVIKVKSNGNVGIGVVNPITKFEVQTVSADATSGSQGISITDDSPTKTRFNIGVNSSNYVYLMSSLDGTGYRPLVLNPNGGNVGFGTTTPPLKLSLQPNASGGNNSVTPLIALQDDRSDRYASINMVRGAGSYDIGLSFSTVYETGGSTAITEKVRIQPNGNLGIGTTNPAEKIELGSVAQEEVKYSFVTPSSNWGQVHSSISFQSNDGVDANTDFGINLWRGTPGNGYGNSARKLTVKSDGKVGIGTQNPLFNFETKASLAVFAQTNENIKGILAWTNSDSLFTIDTYNFANGTRYPIALQPQGGNVGIGVFVPTSKLDIGVVASGTTNNVTQIITNSDDGKGMYNGIDIVNRVFYWRKNDSDDYGFDFQKNDGTSFLRISSNSNVVSSGTITSKGLFATIPTANTPVLKITGGPSGFTNTQQMFDNASINLGAGYFAMVLAGDNSSGQTKMQFTNSIGSGPCLDLQMNPLGGRISIGPGGNFLSLQVQGNLQYSGTIAQGSDKRLKKNIKPLKDSLSKILKTNGVSFDRTDSDAKNQIGFIADDFEKEFPELVYTSDEPYQEGKGLKSINYSAMVAVLVEGMKEMQLKINDLTAEIDKLKN